MSQYTERHFPLVGNTVRPWFHWPYYSDHPDSVYNNTWQNSPAVEHFQQHFPVLSDYPESAQRTILTSSPDDIDTALYDQRRSHSRSTLWDTNAPGVDEFQYSDLQVHAQDTEEAMVDTQCSESRQTSPPASVSVAPSLSVKVEPEDPDGCFIMELSSMSPSFGLSPSGTNQAAAPPTEVPLRATQASKEMRKMMGVFRLNPFAMHTGEGRGVMPAPWCGGGPLEKEPLIFEFQLDIEDDTGDRQFDYVAMHSGSPTDSLGAEEEAQLRSFSPSFELHPEDLRSETAEDYEQEPEEPDRQSDPDYGGNQSEVDTSSTTHSVHTPSETQSAHTPFNESSVFPYPTPPPAVSTWDIESYQPHREEYLPHAEKMEGRHKMHRVHTASHPYLRRNPLNHQASSSSSTHSLSQSQPHLHSRPDLNFGYPVLQQPTYHQHQHYNHVPSQSHSQSYSQLSSYHESMASASLELIPVPSHRLEDSMSSSYMRSGRTLKLAEDETSTLHHHHPAGIVNDYTPRGTASNTYTGQHADTHANGHQYETIQHSSFSSSGHVLSTSRRWSLPETIGGPFRGTM